MKHVMTFGIGIIVIQAIFICVNVGIAQEVIDSTIIRIYTAEQAERGAQAYEKSCGLCHQPAQFQGEIFMDAWAGQTVEALYTLIRTTMPYDRPSGLSRKEYTDILAYIFALNGLPAGKVKLPSSIRKLKKILIEPLPKKGANDEN